MTNEIRYCEVCHGTRLVKLHLGGQDRIWECQECE